MLAERLPDPAVGGVLLPGHPGVSPARAEERPKAHGIPFDPAGGLPFDAENRQFSHTARGRHLSDLTHSPTEESASDRRFVRDPPRARFGLDGADDRVAFFL